MTIKIDGIEAVSKKLENLQQFSIWAYKPMDQTTALIKSKLAKYPRKNQNAFSQLATNKQKKAYWTKVSKGIITHVEGMGYVRSGTLGRKWTRKTINIPNGVRGEVGNNSDYAPYVQSALQQQPFHGSSKWTTDNLALRRTDAARTAVWRAAIRRVIDRP